MRTLGFLSVFLVCAAAAWAQTSSPSAGVPLDVATSRAAVIFDLRYHLTLAVPKSLAEPITGTNRITFDLRSNTQPLVIDFETSRDHVKSVQANGAVAAFEYLNGHVIVPSTALKTGRNEIVVTFNAGDASLNRSADFLYTLFVPARARLAIPVFDQPDLKARWTLTLDLSGGVEGGEQRRGGGDRRDGRDATGRVRQRHDADASPRPQPLLHLSLRVRRRRLQGRDRRAQRPHVPHVPPRDRRREGGAQPRRDLRSARRGARLARALHGHPVRRSASSTSC